MHLLSLAAIGSFATLSYAASSKHVMHEKRNILPYGWQYHSASTRGTTIPVRIGLTQSNLDIAHDKLMEVSDPDSPKYGQHWSDHEIADFFAPSRDSVDAIRSWLHEAGIAPARIAQSENKGWLDFDATTEEMEDLLKTKYHVYKHETGKLHLACDSYHVPEDISKHVDIITPTVHFDARVADPEMKKRRRRSLGAEETAALKTKREEKRDINTWSGPKLGNKPLPNPNVKQDFSYPNICGEYIIPECLRALYNLTRNTLNLSTFGIVEYYPETFLQTDLDLFQSNDLADIGLQTNSGRVPLGTAPLFAPIDGGSLSNMTGFGYQGEPDLDLEYAMDLAYPQQVTLLQAGDNGTYGAYFSFNNFLDALDKSYCSYKGGDDPYYDEPFPDPGGWNKKEQCGVYDPPAVISTSYAYNEHDLSAAYEARQCHEYMKLGLKGTSFLFSSGDYGVAGNGGQCINSNGTYNSGTTGRFNPSFPGTCPYVTAVGATQIPEHASSTTPETACETVIYSGGGFSNNFAMPNYQKKAVSTYFELYKPTYGATRYNNSQQTRGFPDISANGANYVVYIDGVAELVYGTSASAPVFAAIVSQLNNQRLNAGKTVLGFLNPAFYKYPAMFNDITSGTNQGCGTVGFSAVPGWDPVTGLGTPNYALMLKHFMSLK